MDFRASFGMGVSTKSDLLLKYIEGGSWGVGSKASIGVPIGRDHTKKEWNWSKAFVSNHFASNPIQGMPHSPKEQAF